MRDPLLEEGFRPLVEESRQRTRELLAHYKITFDPDIFLDEQRAMAQLARDLARDLIPNFDVLKLSGRKKERPLDFNDRLVAQVDRKRSSNARLSIEAICRNLAKANEWKGYSESTLEARYHEGRAKIAERERLLDEHMAAVYEAAVEDRKKAEAEVEQRRQDLADALAGKWSPPVGRGLLSDLASQFPTAVQATGKGDE